MSSTTNDIKSVVQELWDKIQFLERELNNLRVELDDFRFISSQNHDEDVEWEV